MLTSPTPPPSPAWQCVVKDDPKTGKREVAGVHWDYDCYGAPGKKKLGLPQVGWGGLRGTYARGACMGTWRRTGQPRQVIAIPDGRWAGVHAPSTDAHQSGAAVPSLKPGVNPPRPTALQLPLPQPALPRPIPPR